VLISPPTTPDDGPVSKPATEYEIGAATLIGSPEIKEHRGDEGVVQRKTVEAQIELKGNGKNYTVSPQMADAPKEVIPVQKKQ
jgi:hypothetical protein